MWGRGDIVIQHIVKKWDEMYEVSGWVSVEKNDTKNNFLHLPQKKHVVPSPL